MLNVGDKAPSFSLPDTDMEFRALKDFRGTTLVLYFYPKDDTPGCTLQATEFSELLDEFDATGARIVGVSRDDCFSHQSFRDKLGLKFELLADVDGEACEAYDVLREKEKNGVRVLGIQRSTFVIDARGTIQYVRYGVSPGRHAGEILDVVRRLTGGNRD